jgi:transcriptional regulator with XRE-family HTH domain
MDSKQLCGLFDLQRFLRAFVPVRFRNHCDKNTGIYIFVKLDFYFLLSKVFAVVSESDTSCEVGIGKRLREFREALRISRTAFAFEIAIGSERMASYESGRVPLRWGVFSAISKRFLLNPLWLATGTGSQRLEFPFDESGLKSVDPRKRFSEVMIDIVNEAGSSELIEIDRKATRLGGLLAELVDFARLNKIPPEMLPKLTEMLDAWRDLGVLVDAGARREMSNKTKVASLAKAATAKAKK